MATRKTPAVRKVAIVGGNRIPFARSNGPYSRASNQDMFTAALDGLVSRFSLQGEVIGEVAAGAVLKHSKDFNLARESVLGSKLSPATPASDVQMACGTGLQAVINVAHKIALGEIDSAIAGGVDTTSDAPLAVNANLRQILVQLNAAKTLADRLKLVAKIRPGHIVPEIPRNAEPRTGLSMGEHAALTAQVWDVTREAQDELAATSHRNLAAAYDRGFFDDLVTPYLKLARDQNLRPDSSAEKLAKLKPVYGGPDGTMTAGNSTPLTDGASTVLLATEQWAKAHNLPVLAYLTFSQTAAVDYVHGDEGLLMAPAYAVPRMLERAGLTLQDFDFYEIHEAFASQVLATLKAWEDPAFAKEKLGLDAPLGSIDRAKLNVNGSSLAAGHPFAATGGRIVATLAKLLNEKGSGRGLISICAAGGQGVTAILEK
ncbi:acetyl-CoA C-acetyltransferase [Amycolatopsis rubida]|uniref:Acetyl-CoA C-acetyltransferase n=1 Tax=Amycolatopsis rubida TaxID=112413 RepID=A0A1I5FD64_9PSEU|nr:MULTISPECIES: acetyl-CoA C-acetyltransferase [Amycolatopsis]MYW91849.1 acetyl-CoA C-acetyltransferase [Amycolatopsis rubida]NEC56834.1 acetyl-CoA C-acetyltransferase [Amycolatopsis rubida]OAP27998.1 3-ketoacyl-CoA thiolase [Amycolatopsis sp. M39]SFO21677.1 acetyl-CoA C-acetyltransferase [Amycolatopsis rubida]